ncbi:MAG: FHA domain-containing protein [Acidimicrobiales bacterium]
MSGTFWVQVLEPGHPSRVVTVTDEIDVGRDCDGLLLDDPTVSRRHCKLDPTAVGLVVEDLASANGTYVGGTPIDGPVVLGVGDEIRLGETRLVVHQAHATEQEHAGATGDEVVLGEGQRVSEEARRLGAAANASRPRSR